MFTRTIFFSLAVLAVAPSFAQRATVAVLPVRNAAGIEANVADAMTEMLITALAKSGKFEIVERQEIERIVQEQNLSSTDLIDPSTAAQIGKMKGADYLLMAAVTEAGAKSDSVGLGSISIQQQKAILGLDVRFVDSASGSTKLAETFREERKAGGLGGLPISFDVSHDIGAEMARSLVDRIAQMVLMAAYPPQVVKSDDNGVILNYGNSLFKVGDILEVFTQGEELKDPATGQSLGMSEIRTGRLVIASVTEKVSTGTLVEGTANAGCICRKIVVEQTSKGKKLFPKRRK